MSDQQSTDLTTRFRNAMAGVCTPVAVVTAMDGDRPHGSTVSAFASLSVSPASVLVSLDTSSELLGHILRSGVFGMNVLGSDQAALAGAFARKGPDKFADVSWSVDHSVPRIAGVAHWIAAEIIETTDVTDHVVVFGRAVEVESALTAPLTYYEREFGTHSAQPSLCGTGG